MLERMSRGVAAGGSVRAIADDGREPTMLRAGDWMGFRSRFWTMLGRSDGPGTLEPRPRAGGAGLGERLERMSRVVAGGGSVRAIADDGREPTMLRAGDWMGFRSRFWTMLVRSDGPGTLEPRPGASGALGLSDERGRLSWRYTFYSGPLEKGALTRADPQLGRLLFSGLW